MIANDSLTQMNKRILAMFAPPKPKPRLRSFRRFYTQSAEKTIDREVTPPRSKQSESIDGFYIEKIETLAPSRIEHQLSKTRNKSQKIKS